MNIIKSTASIISLAFALGSISFIANAEETATATTSNPNAVIVHIVAAKSEIMHRDFVAPSEHLKAARAEAQKITVKSDSVKQAAANLVQAQVKLNQADKTGAVEDLNKALELYKSLKSE